jgi:hypothetical protein
LQKPLEIADVAPIKVSKREGSVRSRRRLWPWIILSILFAGMLFPFETTVVPQWKARVVDEKGNLIKMIGVREVWQHYSIESEGHEEDSVTDNDGYVEFPQRKIRANLLSRIGRPLVNLLNVHSSSGASAYLIVLGDDSTITTHNTYSPGEPPPTEVVLKQMNRQK